ncbi:hypothetical protein BC943DRAFT_339176 [Umbelopsis sp. AD052]|nr:hypothetical protein BC943DRAFT_339176 [Umbelopsis sp. AD052]
MLFTGGTFISPGIQSVLDNVIKYDDEFNNTVAMPYNVFQRSYASQFVPENPLTSIGSCSMKDGGGVAVPFNISSWTFGPYKNGNITHLSGVGYETLFENANGTLWPYYSNSVAGRFWGSTAVGLDTYENNHTVLSNVNYVISEARSFEAQDYLEPDFTQVLNPLPLAFYGGFIPQYGDFDQASATF